MHPVRHYIRQTNNFSLTTLKINATRQCNVFSEASKPTLRLTHHFSLGVKRPKRQSTNYLCPVSRVKVSIHIPLLLLHAIMTCRDDFTITAAIFFLGNMNLTYYSSYFLPLQKFRSSVNWKNIPLYIFPTHLSQLTSTDCKLMY